MAASDGKGWEKTLKRGLDGKGSRAGGKPVRLSDLAPPTGQASGRGRPGAPAGPPLSGRPAAPSVPLRPPGPPPQNPPAARRAPTGPAAAPGPPPPPSLQPPPADAVAGLRAEVRKSEDDRRRAEARVAELERKVAGFLAGAPGAPGASGENGDGRAEIERLRRELEEAHTIIRAIEQAYLAGGGEAAPEFEPPVI